MVSLLGRCRKYKQPPSLRSNLSAIMDMLPKIRVSVCSEGITYMDSSISASVFKEKNKNSLVHVYPVFIMGGYP
jgi:hypothetical protein